MEFYVVAALSCWFIGSLILLTAAVHDDGLGVCRPPNAHELHAFDVYQRQEENRRYWRVQRKTAPLPKLPAGSQWWHGGALISIVSFDGQRASYIRCDGLPGGELPAPACRMLVRA